MIRIFYGKNRIDRAGFVFARAEEMMSQGFSGALILVPDQYTLETEKKAFSALQKEGLMDIEIMSFSRMAAKLIPARDSKKYIDDISRSMILRKVISENRDELKLFARAAGKTDFVRMAGDTIQEFKSFGTTPEEVLELAGDDSLLGKKLAEMGLIYQAYEEEKKGRFLDTEDYLERLCAEIRRSRALEGKAVFVTGFDFFSGRLLAVMEELAVKCKNLNLVLMKGRAGEGDEALFEPLESTVAEIIVLGERINMRTEEAEIPEGFERRLTDEIALLMDGIYSFPAESAAEKPEGISITACEDLEVEVDFAAETVINLVTREGMRFKDIAVVVPDLARRASIIKKSFDSRGIACFDDRKYRALDNRFMQLLLSLCNLEKGYGRGEELFRLADTGVMPISVDERELLENYAVTYGITGYMWQRPFYKTDRRRRDEEVAEAELLEAERIRALLVGEVERLFSALAGCKTGGEYAQALSDYLAAELKLEEKIQEDSDRLKAEGSPELAEGSLQLWQRTRGILDRLSLLLEKYSCEREEFFEILRTGIESLELGLIPARADNVIVTDVAGASVGEYKAVIFMGMCEGLVPSTSSPVGLLSDRDRAGINEAAGREIIGNPRRTEREKLEIYRALSAATEKLFLTYYITGPEKDSSARPSPLIQRIRGIFPGLPTQIIFGKSTGDKYHRRRAPEPELLDERTRRELFGSNLIMSPTSLEAYAHCPFAHFLKYGIRADERRRFEAAAPELGTIFHDVIMRFSERLTETRMWQSANEEKCAELIKELAEEAVKDYAGGQLFEGPVGDYRISRIKSVCEKTAVSAATHVQRGDFQEFYFELPFGRKGALPPVKLETEQGRTVMVEGRIDRIDLASAPEGSCIKIVDYKSGSASIEEKEIKSGYRLQLMLYMKAAMDGFNESRPGAVPAGVFYFKIKEPSMETKKAEEAEAGSSEKLEQKLLSEYRMDGLVVNEPWIVNAIDNNLGDEDFSGYSDVIKLQRTKSTGEVRSRSKFYALSSEEFSQLMKVSEDKARGFAGRFVIGDVSIDPMKPGKDADACKYCGYKSICTVDTKAVK